MRRAIQFSALFIVLAAVWVSCSHDDRVVGDLASFIQLQVSEQGGKFPIFTNAVPVIPTTWTYRRDAQGVQIFTSGSNLNAVDGFFRSTIGPPDSATAGVNGSQLIIYKAQRMGVGVNYSCRPGANLHIIILKPLKY